MFEAVLASFKNSSNDNKGITRRAYPRREIDTCIAEINGHSYPVKDWSQSGILIEADPREFDKAENYDIDMHFKVNGKILDANIRGHVVRKNSFMAAFNFEPISMKARAIFSQVIDYSLVNEITETQQA